MTGEEIPAIYHGQVLSILFARANSIAQALPGVANMLDEGLDGLPGRLDAPGVPPAGRRDGERIGEENDSK